MHVTLKLTDTPHLDEYGVSLSPSAMNEGLADFFSAALSGDPDLAGRSSRANSRLTDLGTCIASLTLVTATGAGDIEELLDQVADMRGDDDERSELTANLNGRRYGRAR